MRGVRIYPRHPQEVRVVVAMRLSPGCSVDSTPIPLSVAKQCGRSLAKRVFSKRAIVATLGRTRAWQVARQASSSQIVLLTPYSHITASGR